MIARHTESAVVYAIPGRGRIIAAVTWCEPQVDGQMRN